jgi:glyoxylase-like metal-dependent hydrolase (beta-lactamase superfamily II)
VKKIERRQFLGSAVAVIGSLSLESFIFPFRAKNIKKKPDRIIRLKGSQNSKITHWDIITIGNLSRNRYWGESDERPLRSAICTCTVISGKDFRIIVDPSLEDSTAMATELNRRTGLTPDKIDVVFITHQHGDHLAGLKHFPNARWLAGTEVAKALNDLKVYPKQFEPSGDSLCGAVDVIPSPGHTPDHHSLRFDCMGFSVVIAGDSVATKDYYDERRMYYNALDVEESKRSLEKINLIADIIVPGHDNFFLNL